MRRHAVVPMLLAFATLNGCGAGEAEVSVTIRIDNNSPYCGPQYEGLGLIPCGLEFEERGAEIVSEETGDLIAISPIFEVAPKGVIGPNFWYAEVDVTVPAGQGYEVQIPDCEQTPRFYVDDEDETADELVKTIVNPDGKCGGYTG